MNRRPTKPTLPPKDALLDGLEAKLAEIRARYGKGTVACSAKPPRIPTRFLRLDAALGGGIVPGAIIELYGMEDVGKSGFAQAVAADIQKSSAPEKRLVVFLNYEKVFDPAWARTLGLDTSPAGLYPALHLDGTLPGPDSLEAGVAEAIEAIQTGAVCCLVVDSVYAASSRRGTEAIKNWGDPDAKHAGMAVEAAAWGQALTPLKDVLYRHGTTSIFVNQARVDMQIGGGPKRGAWMPPKIVSTRGAALPFYAWVRIEMRGANLDPNVYPDRDGRMVSLKVVKNKTSGDRRGYLKYALIRGVGFDVLGDLVDLALECDAVAAKGGGNFTVLPGTQDISVRSREKLLALVAEQPKVREALGALVQKHLNRTSDLPAAPAVSSTEPTDEA